MILISNAKTTMKLYVAIALVAVLSITGLYFYFNTMTTVNGALNINKIKEVDKVYSRSIYSDFYFRAIGFSSKQKDDNTNFTKIWNLTSKGSENVIIEDAYYSVLLPQKVSLGYDFKGNKKSKFILQSKNISEGIMRDESGSANKYENYIDLIENFSTIYGKIVATQDQDYFDEVYEDTKKIIKDLYGVDANISKVSRLDFYDRVPVSINNMQIEYFKLNHFKLTDSLKDKKWQPNIAHWSWSDSEIYLQLLEKAKNVDLHTIVKLFDVKPGGVMVKTIKINNNKVSQLVFYFNGNVLETILESADGYIYLLKMDNKNLKSLKTGFNDFLKIAYGVYFTQDSTDTWFYDQQQNANHYFNKVMTLEKEMSLLKPEKEVHAYPEKWDKKFLKFKEYYGSFPNQNIIKELSDKKRRLEKEKEENSMWNSMKKKYQKILN